VAGALAAGTAAGVSAVPVVKGGISAKAPRVTQASKTTAVVLVVTTGIVTSPLHKSTFAPQTLRACAPQRNRRSAACHRHGRSACRRQFRACRITYGFPPKCNPLATPEPAIDTIASQLTDRLQELRSAGTFKAERVLDSPQGAVIRSPAGPEVIKPVCQQLPRARQSPAVLAAAHRALDHSVTAAPRCVSFAGTQSIHRELESRLSGFLAPRIRSSILPALTPTAGCSRPAG